VRSADTARSKERSFTKAVMLADLARQIIVPAYSTFAARCREFDSVAEALARNPGPATLDQAQAAWSNAMLAWRPGPGSTQRPASRSGDPEPDSLLASQRLIDPSVDLAAPVPPTWILALRN
jgi:hypothetical protein